MLLVCLITLNNHVPRKIAKVSETNALVEMREFGKRKQARLPFLPSGIIVTTKILKSNHRRESPDPSPIGKWSLKKFRAWRQHTARTSRPESGPLATEA